VIINDGSKDSTESIVYEYINRGYPIIYHYQENKGLGYSRNEALKRSNGEYIAFIDHDDIWLPKKLEKQIDAFKSQSDIDFNYTNYLKMICYNKNRLITGLKGKQPQGFVFKDFIFKYQVFISTVMVSKKSLDSLEMLFDDRLSLIEEYDVFLRLLYSHKAMYIDEVTAIYRFHVNMTTMTAPTMLLKESLILIDKLKKMDPIFEKLYPDIVNYMDIQWIKYGNAKINIVTGRRREARRFIAPHKWYNFKLFRLYIASFLPMKLYLFIYRNIFYSQGRI
jgi:glycosyltransferase involved in cell wall biosynthesis